jgi:CheY-like chemotaxis protein
MKETIIQDSQQRKKILLIDDEEDFCFFIKLNLEKTGKYEVLTSTSGLTGLTIASQELPDLVLLDIIMPELNGGQVATMLLDNPQTKDIPILFISAIATKSGLQSQDGLTQGGRFIAKPVTPDELMTKLDSVLSNNL